MPNASALRTTLLNLDGASYKAYKEIRGRYTFLNFHLLIDYVQGDPFASPSELRVLVPQAIAQFPPDLFQSYSREVALRDYLTRRFGAVAQEMSGRRGTGKSGLIAAASVGPEILERTAAWIDEDGVELRFVVGLPAQGRRILGRQAAELLCEDIPDLVTRSLLYSNLNADLIRNHVETAEDADFIRQSLRQRQLVAFIADGSILPRRSGVDERPLEKQAIPFQSPPSLAVSFDCPNRGRITGMGIPQGITLIVGGGYHGKSTLLRAIELGVYNHIPQDGREFAITDPSAVKIRAEDGRSVSGVDISPFINHLPQGRSTRQFSTSNASGSTSQAANIMEALEVGCQVLLVDEDTAATNFMIRDRRMQQLIHKDQEPITPFIDKVQQLYQEQGVSTILVMGGSGDYFEVAHRVIALDHFVPRDVTQQAQAIAQEHTTHRQPEGGTSFGPITPRIPLAESIDPSQGHRAVKVKVRDVDEVVFGSEDIDLGAVSQIVETGQLRAIAKTLIYAKEHYLNNQRTLSQIIEQIRADLEQEGLDILSPYPQGNLSEFRPFELAAALNRLRTLQVKQNRD